MNQFRKNNAKERYLLAIQHEPEDQASDGCADGESREEGTSRANKESAQIRECSDHQSDGGSEHLAGGCKCQGIESNLNQLCDGNLEEAQGDCNGKNQCCGSEYTYVF